MLVCHDAMTTFTTSICVGDERTSLYKLNQNQADTIPSGAPPHVTAWIPFSRSRPGEPAAAVQLSCEAERERLIAAIIATHMEAKNWRESPPPSPLETEKDDKAKHGTRLMSACVMARGN